MGVYSKKGKDGKLCWYIDYYYDGKRMRRPMQFGTGILYWKRRCKGMTSNGSRAHSSVAAVR